MAYPIEQAAQLLIAQGVARKKKHRNRNLDTRETEIQTTNKSGEGREKVFAIKHSFKVVE